MGDLDKDCKLERPKKQAFIDFSQRQRTYNIASPFIVLRVFDKLQLLEIKGY